MIVYRLSKGKYRADLSGKGAEIYGGRWNSKGIALVYTSQSRALAFAEVAMHIPIAIVPKDYVLISINIPDSAAIQKVPESDLPTDWRSNPHSHSTQSLGDQFAFEEKFLVFQVPSAVVPGDFNYLINVQHPLHKEVSIQSIEAFEFDSRFVSRGTLQVV